ncbi:MULTISPECIES: GNAT family N-acetyltransferase [Aerococcus]|uniref:GNAT family N-acetyltransferase n=1 Tax=Aerococcus sanguinicola TaxID=119206 RepID=A0A5N1GMA7_9LACT|nr:MULTISPECIES: GNAT family N-acetyltransferase [Aerococcus]KAA9301161.1 GNAT family N-acetyltransferase [Aerococcus sanguinicola]MDK6369310.1 GNAT family N-acetyltransferase [Aerococcus sp. UMB9870]MDK6687181.1 GNAT family N-acetyltransferase [Aerococcus sp. UMB8623]OFK13524.1 hypothetical protein HMPREF2829_05710 [Aerococcus sp. HMSC072A12]OFR32971.1 hypothetical protein HMPREF2892_06870 [Aerococcus sp. HMSC061A03]
MENSSLTASEREQVAAIIVDAFEDKIHYVWIMTSDRAKAKRLIAKHFNEDQLIVSRNQGKIQGILSYESQDKPNFLPIPWHSFRQEFSFFPSLIRSLGYFIYKHSQSQVHAKDWHIDLLAVASEARGQGLGRQLLQKASQAAKANHKKQLILEVVNSNQRGKKFYEENGFQTLKHQDVPLLFRPFTKAAKFTSYYVMKKRV